MGARGKGSLDEDAAEEGDAAESIGGETPVVDNRET